MLDDTAINLEELKLDAKQDEAVRACCDTTRRVVAVTGKAGTGKTTIIRHVYRLLTRAGYGVALAAPTGKAAKRIKEATGIQAQTFHRLLEYSHPGERDEKTGKYYGESVPKRDRQNPLDYDVVIGDEYAMVNQELHANIVAAIRNGGRLLVFGDANQLPPIEKQAVYVSQPSKFVQLLKDYQGITLETIHRTGAGSGIADNGGRILRGFAPLRKDDFTIDITDRPIDSLLRYIDERANEGSDQRDFTKLNNQVITPSNISWVGQHKLNAALQTYYRGGTTKWLDLEREKWEKNPCRVTIGDKVVITENLYTIGANDGTQGVFNGETGIITEITDFGEIEIDLGDRIIVLPPEIIVETPTKRFVLRPHKKLYLAYALTTHKCQGSEYQHVVYLMNKSQFMLLNRYNFYTGVTRARESVHLISDQRALSTACSTTQMKQRD